MQKLYGLIGYPLSHSFSKRYFTDKFDREGLSSLYSYELFPLEDISQLSQLLHNTPALCGFNVTIPHKQAILAYLDSYGPGVADIGAVNTVKIDSGKLTGFNTDVEGFEYDLTQLLAPLQHRPTHALVLGTGGASKAVVWVLKKMNIAYQLVSRQATEHAIAYEDIDAAVLAQHLLIINTSPLGMSPQVDTCPPLPYDMLSNRHVLYDLVYNPEETLFLRRAKQFGAATQNGLAMLYGQAEAAWRIWQL